MGGDKDQVRIKGALSSMRASKRSSRWVEYTRVVEFVQMSHCSPGTKGI